MPSKKQFINPLTRPSDADLHLPAEAERPGRPDKSEAVADQKQKRAKSREALFEDTHQRFTGWVDKKLKKQFDELATKKGVSKSALLDKAIAALLHKQEQKPYTRRDDSD